MDREKMNELLGLTEKEQDKIAADYESDAWDSSDLGKVIIGRPRIANEEIRAITVKLPISQIAALDKRARNEGITRSTVLREAVSGWLAGA